MIMKLLFSLLLCLFSTFLFAQTEVESDLGNVSNEELAYTKCPFDKEASAVVLFDRAISNYDENWHLVTYHRRRIKILNEKGVSYGNVRITYYSEDDFETIRNIKAFVIGYDDSKNVTISKLDLKNIYNTKLNYFLSEITFALPNVKPGSIIDYIYTSDMRSYGGLQKWVFQWEIPVLMSSYELFIIPNYEFAYSIKKSHDLPIEVKSEPGKIMFKMTNIPGLRDEDYMAAAKDYLQQVTFQLSGLLDEFGKKKFATTWKDMAADLINERYFGVQLNKDLSNTSDLKALCARAKTPYDKMSAIYEYVRNGMGWNGVHSIYSNDGIKSAWDKKNGDAGDINLILINLLKANGIDAYPLLISEREHGKVDTTYPFRQQFNKVIAFVQLNDKKYYLDGVNKVTPIGIIPFEFLNTKGFIVDKKKSELITISDDSKQYKDIINIAGKIDASGAIEGDATILNYDYSRIRKVGDFKNDINKYKEFYAKMYTNCKLDSFNVTGFNSDSVPLTESFKLASSLNKSGNYYMLNYNLFTSLNKNPFVTERRFSNIDFGCLHTCLLNEIISIPDNLLIESLPKSTILKTPDNSMVLSRIIEKDKNNNIRVLVKLNITRAEYNSGEYEIVKGFYKQMIEFLDEPVVFKSK
jgi:transglutaminase-like putative cysteine protease